MSEPRERIQKREAICWHSGASQRWVTNIWWEVVVEGETAWWYPNQCAVVVTPRRNSTVDRFTKLCNTSGCNDLTCTGTDPSLSPSLPVPQAWWACSNPHWCALEPAPEVAAQPAWRWLSRREGHHSRAEVGRTRWGQSPLPSRWHGLGRNGTAVWICKLMSWRAWKHQDSPGPICSPICQLFWQQWGEFCQELRSAKPVNQHGFPMRSQSRDPRNTF